MRSVITWVKSNLLIVIAGAICVVSLIALAYIQMDGNSFISLAIENAKKKINQVDSLTRVQATTPAADPDDPPVTHTIKVELVK